MMIDEIIVKPIGVVHSNLLYRYETPRQGVLAGDNVSVIELNPNNNFEQATEHLNGFDRIWVIYWFHLNDNWKPLVNPPRHTRKKIGVFATRAPYRPNQIGMSCVKLEKVEGLKIFISQSDILDGAPVLDIKPYLPYSDSFPGAATGWVKNGLESIFKISFETKAEKQCLWLKDNAGINLANFARLQLEFNPTDTERKRITALKTGNSLSINFYILAYRTWRIIYSVDESDRNVVIKEIQSGYSKEELLNTTEDKYNDKPLHQLFTNHFMYVQ